MKHAIRWLPALAWMGVIFWWSGGPGPRIPGGIEIPDKLAHVGIYAILGGLLWGAAAPAGASGAAKLTIAIGGLYGALDELHQRFVPARSMDLADWVADLGGIVLAVAIAANKQRFR